MAVSSVQHGVKPSARSTSTSGSASPSRSATAISANRAPVGSSGSQPKRHGRSGPENAIAPLRAIVTRIPVAPVMLVSPAAPVAESVAVTGPLEAVIDTGARAATAIGGSGASTATASHLRGTFWAVSAEGKNFEAIVKAKADHNKHCPFPPHTVRMNPFEIERMQWEEGDTIAGLLLESDPKLGAGPCRLVWGGRGPPEREPGDSGGSPAPAAPLEVPAGPAGPAREGDPQ